MKFLIAPTIIVICLFLFFGADWGFGLSVFFLMACVIFLPFFALLINIGQKKSLKEKDNIISNQDNDVPIENYTKNRHSFLHILFIANIIPTGFFALGRSGCLLPNSGCNFIDNNLLYGAPIWYFFATFFAFTYWLTQK